MHTHAHDLMPDIKARLPDYLAELGLEPRSSHGGNKLACKCPLHDDRDPSFTATLKDEVWLWFCHPCGKGGSLIDLHAALHGLDTKGAIRQLKQKYLGDEFDATKPLPPRPKPTPQATRPPEPWPELNTGGTTRPMLLSNLRRGVPLTAVQDAIALGYLRFTTFNDHEYFALTDGDQFLQLRHLTGQKFNHGDGKPFNSYTMRGCTCRPLGLRELDAAKNILIVEGCVGFLELLSLLHLTAARHLWTPLAITGAGMAIPADVLEKLRGRSARIIADNDNSGRKAVEKWGGQLIDADCHVSAKIAGIAGTPKTDLGDLLRLHDIYDNQHTQLKTLITP